jgi:hypothetical protein
MSLVVSLVVFCGPGGVSPCDPPGATVLVRVCATGSGAITAVPLEVG